MPYPFNAISIRLAWLRVFSKAVQRVSLIGPLFLAIDRAHETPVTARRVIPLSLRNE